MSTPLELAVVVIYVVSILVAIEELMGSDEVWEEEDDDE